MITKLEISQFTVFPDATLTFADGINVIVGENGTGKSHLLKLAYCMMSVLARGKKNSNTPKPQKKYLEVEYARKLRTVFRPDSLGRLVNKVSKKPCYVQVTFKENTQTTGITFTNDPDGQMALVHSPSKWLVNTPVFLPTRELLTIAMSFPGMYETSEIPFEETWKDTSAFLSAAMLEKNQLGKMKAVLEQLESLLNGKVLKKENKLFLSHGKGDKTEPYLMAEGFRKIAMLARLIANGVVRQGVTVFWDEPEANMNPKIIKSVAKAILLLASARVQIILASHSLFLLREIDVLLRGKTHKGVSSQFFGLHHSKGVVSVQQNESVDGIGNIDALDESLMQSDRYLKAEGI